MLHHRTTEGLNVLERNAVFDFESFEAVPVCLFCMSFLTETAGCSCSLKKSSGSRTQQCPKSGPCSVMPALLRRCTACHDALGFLSFGERTAKQ